MSNRAAVKRRIANDLGPSVLGSVDLGVEGRTTENVPCVYSLPPDEATESCVYFGGLKAVEGRQDVSGVKRQAPRSDDSFILEGTIDAFGFASDEESDEAAERILNKLNAGLRRWQRLIDPDGDAPDETPGYFVNWARIGDWSLASYAPIGDTHVSRISFSIECSTPTPKEGT